MLHKLLVDDRIKSGNSAVRFFDVDDRNLPVDLLAKRKRGKLTLNADPAALDAKRIHMRQDPPDCLLFA